MLCYVMLCLLLKQYVNLNFLLISIYIYIHLVYCITTPHAQSRHREISRFDGPKQILNFRSGFSPDRGKSPNFSTQDSSLFGSLHHGFAIRPISTRRLPVSRSLEANIPVDPLDIEGCHPPWTKSALTRIPPNPGP